MENIADAVQWSPSRREGADAARSKQTQTVKGDRWRSLSEKGSYSQPAHAAGASTAAGGRDESEHRPTPVAAVPANGLGMQEILGLGGTWGGDGAKASEEAALAQRRAKVLAEADTSTFGQKKPSLDVRDDEKNAMGSIFGMGTRFDAGEGFEGRPSELLIAGTFPFYPFFGVPIYLLRAI